MSNVWYRIKRKGFTLVELLVVIAIIGILVSIVMPAITDALTRGKLTQCAANGRNLIQGLMAKETQDIYTSSVVVWPATYPYKTGDQLNDDYFDSSTGFFNWLVTNRIMNVNYNFFAASGVPAASSEEDFLDSDGEKTAWCIVGDVSTQTSETDPVLFTRNLGKDSFDGGNGNAYNKLDPDVFKTQDDMYSYFVGEPFQTKGFVFVSKGGSAIAPFKDDMRVEAFTNLFKVYKDPNTTFKPMNILRPDSGDSSTGAL